MKHLAITVAALAALSIGPAFAAGTVHDQHHDGTATALQLNAGRKWETDAALRKAMGEMRQSVAAKLHAIHEDRLPPKAYAALAARVEGAVANIVAQCKLPPAADEQLHVIVTELLAGAEQMAGKTKSGQPRDGAVKVIEALDNYGRYFDDPGYKPLGH